MAQPLPWVKAHTRVLTSMRWLALPIEERGVFDHLTRLGGVGSKRGFVEGTDAQIASLIHCSSELVTQTVDHLSAKPYDSLKRRRGGVLIANWHQYQAPDNYDPDVQSERGRLGGRPRKPTLSDLRKPTLSTNGNPTGEGEGEEDKKREDVLAALAVVPGYPFEHDTDALFVAKLREDFPGVNLSAECRKWAVYKLDKPFTARSSPRSQFRTWAANSITFAARDKRDVVAPLASVDDQLAALRGGR